MGFVVAHRQNRTRGRGAPVPSSHQDRMDYARALWEDDPTISLNGRDGMNYRLRQRFGKAPRDQELMEVRAQVERARRERIKELKRLNPVIKPADVPKLLPESPTEDPAPAVPKPRFHASRYKKNARGRIQFPPEFKEHAVALASELGVKEAAKKLGCNPLNIERWSNGRPPPKVKGPPDFQPAMTADQVRETKKSHLPPRFRAYALQCLKHTPYEIRELAAALGASHATLSKWKTAAKKDGTWDSIPPLEEPTSEPVKATLTRPTIPSQPLGVGSEVEGDVAEAVRLLIEAVPNLARCEIVCEGDRPKVRFEVRALQSHEMLL